MAAPPFALDRPRYDPSTFVGRWKLYSDRMIYPQGIFLGSGAVAIAKARLDDFKTGHPTLDLDDADLWEARRVCEVALSAETGGLLPWYLRTPVFLATMTSLGFAIMDAAKYTTKPQMAMAMALWPCGLALAVGSSSVMDDLLLKPTPSSLGLDKVTVKDHEGVVRGTSTTPVRAIDRAAVIASVADLMPYMVARMSDKFVKQPAVVRVGVVAMAGWTITPFILAALRQDGSIAASDMTEPEFHGMKDSQGRPVDRFIYDHSIWTSDHITK